MKAAHIVLLYSLFATLLRTPSVSAQTNSTLSLQLYAGLTISGTVGNTYTVSYTTDLSQTNHWQILTNLVLPASPYLLMDTNVAATAQRFYRVQTANTNQPISPAGMVRIPAGSFVMGDSVDGDSDSPTLTVNVSAFYIDTNLVTYALWQQVYQWAVTNGYSFDGAGAGVGTNYPVQTVDWYDAVKWCNARSQMAGLPPVYYTDAGLTQVYVAGDVDGYVNWTVGGYRLPTESEWEKAARGALTGQRFPFGNTISESRANYYGNPLSGSFGYSYDMGPGGLNTLFNTGFGNYFSGYSSPVGYFAPNGYGLYDMAGNVFEWCWDWYGPYGTDPQTDPHGSASGTARVQRGGSWIHFANECRASAREQDSPTFGNDDLGFRTVLPQF